jgi:ankyrin repeat protein
VVRSILDRAEYRANGYIKELYTLLRWVAKEGCEARLEFLLDRANCDFNARDNNGQSAFLLASDTGHEAILDRADVDANATGGDSNTPQIRAASRRHDAVAKLLLDRGDVDVNAKNHYGMSAFL